MKKRKFADGGIYTAEMGQPPMDPEGGPPPPKRMIKRPPMAGKKPPMPVKRPAMPVAPRPSGTPPDASAMPAPTYKNGGSVGSASKRADGCAVKGKTKGKML